MCVCFPGISLLVWMILRRRHVGMVNHTVCSVGCPSVRRESRPFSVCSVRRWTSCVTSAWTTNAMAQDEGTSLHCCVFVDKWLLIHTVTCSDTHTKIALYFWGQYCVSCTCHKRVMCLFWCRCVCRCRICVVNVGFGATVARVLCGSAESAMNNKR